MSQKKSVTRIGIAYALYMIIGEVAATLIMLFIQSVAPDLAKNANMQLLVGTLPSYLFAFPVVYLMVRNLPKLKPYPRKITVGWFFAVFTICMAGMFAGALLGQVLGKLLNLIPGVTAENAVSDLVMQVNPALIILTVVIIAPIIEEFLYRKLLLDRIGPISRQMAIILSGLMFGLFHANVYQFFYAFIIGMIFASIYLNTGKIQYTIFLHMMVNFMGSVVSLYVSQGNNPVVTVAYGLFYMALMITGIIMFILNCKAFMVQDIPGSLPKDIRSKTIFLAPGMFAFYVVTLLLLILSLLM